MCFLNLVISTPSEAFTSVSVGIVAPAPRAVVVAPARYPDCYMIHSGYSYGVWINQHQVCHSYDSPATWVSAHWECHHFDKEGLCKHWSWVPSYWTSPEMARPPVMGPPPIVEGPVYAEPPVVVENSPVFFGFSGGYYHGHYHRHG